MEYYRRVGYSMGRIFLKVMGLRGLDLYIHDVHM
jgi:hypothetical protein